MTKDHIVPKSKGGIGAMENLVGACSVCNTLKGTNQPHPDWIAERIDLFNHRDWNREDFDVRVSVAGGKYEVVMEEDFRLHALRYGKPWRDCVGDNLVLCLAMEVEALRKRVGELESGKGDRGE